jgi:hypothetical protein
VLVGAALVGAAVVVPVAVVGVSADTAFIVQYGQYRFVRVVLRGPFPTAGSSIGSRGLRLHHRLVSDRHGRRLHPAAALAASTNISSPRPRQRRHHLAERPHVGDRSRRHRHFLSRPIQTTDALALTAGPGHHRPVFDDDDARRDELAPRPPTPVPAERPRRGRRSRPCRRRPPTRRRGDRTATGAATRPELELQARGSGPAMGAGVPMKPEPGPCGRCALRAAMAVHRCGGPVPRLGTVGGSPHRWRS